jgi:hypothetical protein
MLRLRGAGRFLPPDLSSLTVSSDLGRSSALPKSMQTGNRKMFTIIRKFALTRGSAKEVTRRVEDSFVPLLRNLPGFRGYYLLDGGPDVLISIRVFDNADEAFASNEIAANWLRNHVLEFTKGMPEVIAGNVLVSEFKHQ